MSSGRDIIIVDLVLEDQEKRAAEEAEDDRTSKKARVAIGADSLVTLVHAYNMHFSK